MKRSIILFLIFVTSICSSLTINLSAMDRQERQVQNIQKIENLFLFGLILLGALAQTEADWMPTSCIFVCGLICVFERCYLNLRTL